MDSVTESDFVALLLRMESETLDFKGTEYDFAGDGNAQYAFIKDVICLANTPRSETAYLVLGVKKLTDGRTELWGVASHPDEASLQQYFTDRIYPPPVFTYQPLSHQGRQFGLVIVPPERRGPCIAVKDLGEKVRARQVYFRRGTRNDVALPEEVHRIIEWARGAGPISSPAATSEPVWNELRAALQLGEPGRTLALVASTVHDDTGGRLAALGLLPWNVVLDFDPDSESTGVHSRIAERLNLSRAIHLVVKGDRPTLGLKGATYWIFARGLRGRSDTVATGTWRTWLNEYGQELSEQLARLSASLSPSPATFLVLWHEEGLTNHLRSTLEMLVGAFGASAAILMIGPASDDMKRLSDQFEARLFDISLVQLCSGLDQELGSFGALPDTRCVLPSASGAAVALTTKERLWVEEECEIVHLNAGVAPDDNVEVGRSFLRGGEIAWYELGLRWDVDRDRRAGLQRRVLQDLEGRRCVRVNLYHAPGAGGSTVARRVLWELHRLYPSVVLRRSTPPETAERIFRLASLTGQPVLVLVDGAAVPEGKTDELFDVLRSRNIPAVLLQVLRRFASVEERDRAFYLSAELTVGEARRFSEIFGDAVPARRESFRALESRQGERDCTPFFFGLTAFGSEFVGLDPYVRNHLGSLTDVQQRIVLTLAFVHHYAHRALPAQVFWSALGSLPDRSVRLARILPGAGLDLLLEEQPGVWRTTHDLIAREVLAQLLRPSGGDQRAWPQGLSRTAIGFLRLCHTAAPSSEELLDVLQRLLVRREGIEGTAIDGSGPRSFSRLVEEIPSDEGRLEVLREAVRLFPAEAHFWAHLGRYLAVQMRAHEEALGCIERAIGLQPRDPVLHHMHGMALRYKVEELSSSRAGLEEIVPVARGAGEAFAKVRELRPDEEHGYISEAQMLIALLDYAGRPYGGVFRYLTSAGASPYLVEALDKAEDLLEQVRRNREGGSRSPYEEACRARLATIYGRYDSALQTLDGLLARGGVYKPAIRRQLIRTYLARRNRNWAEMGERELRRVVALLEENLQEKTVEERDLRLWIQAVRFLPTPPTVESVIERVAYWRANTGSLDASYYLYVLHALLAFEGSELHREEALANLEQCRLASRGRRRRTYSFEWLGTEDGLRGLIHQSELGEWNQKTDFWDKTEGLAWLPARIARVDGPQAGTLEVEGGLLAFFVPARGGYVPGDENMRVECFLGFSYDGLRAWNVTRQRS